VKEGGPALAADRRKRSRRGSEDDENVQLDRHGRQEQRENILGFYQECADRIRV
jgi:hypothetical protein